jgi:flagellar basal-body rod protein FlgG
MVEAKIQGEIEMRQLGQLELATFVNPVGLEAIADNLLLETEASGPATFGPPRSAGFGSVLQGFLESSNVNPVQEITSLITAQRAYDMNSKVISASDEMMMTVTQLR